MKRRCPHCEKNGIRATLEPVGTSRGNVDRCWQCGGEYVGDDLVYPKPVAGSTTVLELRKDTAALKQLAELEEHVKVPPERGGYHFSDWERSFIASVREQHNDTLEFTEKQRAKIKDIWQASDLKKRASPDEKTENLFSNLSPARQTEQLARAKRVKLPWET